MRHGGRIQTDAPIFHAVIFQQPVSHGIVRGELGRIVQRLEFQIRIALLQRCREQMVTKRGVFRQDRAVAVCAEDILIAYPHSKSSPLLPPPTSTLPSGDTPLPR